MPGSANELSQRKHVLRLIPGPAAIELRRVPAEEDTLVGTWLVLSANDNPDTLTVFDNGTCLYVEG